MWWAVDRTLRLPFRGRACPSKRPPPWFCGKGTSLFVCVPKLQPLVLEPMSDIFKGHLLWGEKDPACARESSRYSGGTPLVSSHQAVPFPSSACYKRRGTFRVTASRFLSPSQRGRLEDRVAVFFCSFVPNLPSFSACSQVC